MTDRRQFMQALGASFLVGGCAGRQRNSYRYKLTLQITTPERQVEAWNVVEVAFPHLPRSTAAAVRGEAVFADPGPGWPPIVALLVKIESLDGRFKSNMWGDLHPTSVLRHVYDIPSVVGENSDWLDALKQKRGKQPLALSQLPTIVTFADTLVPASVSLFDPSSPSTSYGRGISLNAFIEIVDEPLTRSIKTKLPWLAAPGQRQLDGQTTHRAGGGLANRLSTEDFCLDM